MKFNLRDKRSDKRKKPSQNFKQKSTLTFKNLVTKWRKELKNKKKKKGRWNLKWKTKKEDNKRKTKELKNVKNKKLKLVTRMLKVQQKIRQKTKITNTVKTVKIKTKSNSQTRVRSLTVMTLSLKKTSKLLLLALTKSILHPIFVALMEVLL